MKTIIVSNEHYSVIDLTLEYENWTGTEKYAIVSDLEQGYIESVFANELDEYKPYLFLSEGCLSAFTEYKRNDEKFKFRHRKLHIPFSFEEGDTDNYHDELSVPSFDTEWIVSEEIKYALSFLTEKERSRIVAFYFRGMTLQEIADESNCRFQSVHESIESAKKKLRNILKSL